MIKIGDFSKLAHVTVKTLRYYASIGLLKPAWIDRYSSYRYYALDQLPRLNRILALKDLGFSLQQVARMIDDELSAEQLRGMVRIRQAELQNQIETEQHRLSQVEARLRQIEAEGRLPGYEVILKTVPPLSFASVRELVRTINDLPGSRRQMAAEVRDWMKLRNLPAAGLWTAIYYNPEYTERLIEVELGIEVQTRLQAPVRGRVGLRTLPEIEKMASVVHTGSRAEITGAYTAFYSWVDANDYRLCGPVREIYIDEGNSQSCFGEASLDACAITELQFPVERETFFHGLDSDRRENQMEPKFVTLPAFTVAGTHYHGKNQNQEIAEMWGKEFMPRMGEIKSAEPGVSYGVCTDMEPDGEFEYIACVKVASPQDAPADMFIYEVPEQRYAVFEHHGSLQALRDTNNYIYQSWLPKSGYRRTSGPDLEMYTDAFNDFKEDSILYLYVPVEEK